MDSKGPVVVEILKLSLIWKGIGPDPVPGIFCPKCSSDDPLIRSYDILGVAGGDKREMMIHSCGICDNSFGDDCCS